MDDKDQTQIRPFDSSATQTRSSSKRRQQPTDQSASAQQAAPFPQTSDTFAVPTQSTQPFQTDTQAQSVQLSQTGTQTRQPKTRSAKQVTKPQPLLPQPILFSDKEDILLLEEQIVLPSVRPQPWRRTRNWLRSRTGRVVIPLLTLLLGLTFGLTSIIWYGLSGEGSLILVAPAAQGNLVVDANRAFVTQLVSNNLASAGLPGQVRNIAVDLKHGALLVIQGDDVYSLLFVTFTKHFTIDLQPYVQSCVLQVRITHVDLSGIPVTTFAQTFQNQINQQLAKKPAGLPSGFTYCTVGVSTEPGGMFITYQATPVK